MRSCILALPFLIGAALVPLVGFADEPKPKPPEAKTVSLSGSMKVSAALAKLTEQTKIPVADHRGAADTEITLDVKNATVLQALDQIADAADAQVDFYTSDGKLALKKRTGKMPAKGTQTVSYDGLFRTAIKAITPSIDLETGEITYRALIEVAWEPTLQPYYIETRPQNLVVKDDKMKEILPINLGSALAPADGRNAILFDTLLPTPPREAKMIGQMDGNFTIVAPTKMLMFSFKPTLDKLKEGDNVTLEDVECKLSKLKVANERCTVQVTLSYPPGNTKLDTDKSWIVNNELVLESKDGKTRYPATGFVLDSSNPQRVIVTYNFQDDPKQNRVRGDAKNWKLSYRAPAAVVTIPFAFSFKNVPLP